LTKSGTIDSGPLLAALAATAEADRTVQLTDALNEILYGFLFAVRKSIGPDHEANILKALRPDSVLIEA
jgi:hypothetical protein